MEGLCSAPQNGPKTGRGGFEVQGQRTSPGAGNAAGWGWGAVGTRLGERGEGWWERAALLAGARGGLALRL